MDLVALLSRAVASSVASSGCGAARDALLLCSRADAEYVRAVVLPLLRACGLQVATLQDVLEPGMDALLGLEQSLASARRVVAVLGAAFADERDGYGALERHALAQRKAADVATGRFSIIPVYVEDPEPLRASLPAWLAGLVGIELESGDFATGVARLVRALQSSVIPSR